MIDGVSSQAGQSYKSIYLGSFFATEATAPIESTRWKGNEWYSLGNIMRGRPSFELVANRRSQGMLPHLSMNTRGLMTNYLSTVHPLNRHAWISYSKRGLLWSV